jgi:cell division protein FtsQ
LACSTAGSHRSAGRSARLELRAEYAHVSAEQIRAAVSNHLGKGFFALELADVQDAVAKLPWVERVEARKHWPDTLSLTVYERRPFARWGTRSA